MPRKPIEKALALSEIRGKGDFDLSLPPGSKLKTQEAREMMVMLIVSGARNNEINTRLIDAGHITSPISDRGISEWRKKPEVEAALNKRHTETLQAGWASLGLRVKRLGELNDMVIEAITVVESDPDGNTHRRLVDGSQTTMLGVQQVRENTKVIAEMLDPKRFGISVGGDMNVTQVNAHSASLGLDSIGKDKLLEYLKEATEFIEGEIVDEPTMDGNIVSKDEESSDE